MTYETDKEYNLPVFYVPPQAKSFTVKTADEQYIEIPITGKLLKRISSGSRVMVVCTDVAGNGKPSFELAKSYYPTVIDRGEGKTVEFKQSIVFSPETNKPDASQPLQIAKEIAAFMNSDGGTLYLGVSDNGRVVGIEDDLPYLGKAVLAKGDYTDASHTYHANNDGFALKLHALIRFYLGDVADTLVDGPFFQKDNSGERTYAVLKIRPSEKDVIYWGPKELVCYRSGSASTILLGRTQDEYVRRRFYERTEFDYSALLAQLTAEQSAENEKVQRQLQAISEALKNGQALPPVQVVTGPRVQFSPESVIPLTSPHFNAVEAITGIIYKNQMSEQRYRDAKTWKEFYEQMLGILAELFPEKFSALPDLEEFKPTRKTAEPYFVRKGNRRKLTSCSDYLGSHKDIRANLSCATKAAFIDPRRIPAKVLAYFGVNPGDFAVVTK